MRIHKAVLILFLATGLSPNAEASGVSVGDTIEVVISDPVLTGYDVNNPDVGQRVFFDNTQTVVSTIFTNPLKTVSSITWGSNTGGGPGTQSQILFDGQLPIAPDFANTPFPVAFFQFTNGTSAGETLIFGATLSFFDHQTATFLGSDQLIITTTNNLGNSQSQDADYINICGAGSNICSTSISAYESKEDIGPRVLLYGVIVGDPVLTLTGVTLTGNGELGNQLPIGAAAAPEISTWAMMLLGFVGVGFMAYRRKQNGRTFRMA